MRIMRPNFELALMRTRIVFAEGPTEALKLGLVAQPCPLIVSVP